METQSLQVHKYQALGNDMLAIDPAHFGLPLNPAVVQLLCDRHFGLGADGICYGPLSSPGEPFLMRFFNPDGSEAEKSGNGLRIFARYLVDAAYVSSREFKIRIQNSIADVERLDETGQRFAIGMGKISFRSSDIPMTGPERAVVGEALSVAGTTLTITAVNVGNPHCVHFTADLEAVTHCGPLLERDPHFPNRTNVQFAEVVDEHTIRIAIWERGAGYTLASGTSATATAAAALRNGLCISPITVQMAGGTAVVAIDAEWQAMLTGSVAAVFHGRLAPDLARACFAKKP